MKITFFGAGHGVPEPNRKCSSTMIEACGNRYIIDMGSQAIEDLVTRRVPLETLKAVFITHMHGDHTNGLMSFIDLCSWFWELKNANPKFYLPGDLDRSKAAITEWLACNGTKIRPFEFLPVNEGVLFDDGALRVTAYRTKHTDSSFSYLLEAEGKRVLFSGDLNYDGPAKANDFPVAALEKPVDLAVCEMAHFEATEYYPILKGNKSIKKLCFNHYSPRFMVTLSQALKDLAADYEVFLAADGMEIEV